MNTSPVNVYDAARALPLVARLATTRDCFGSLMLISKSIRAAIPSHIELVHFPEGTDDETIVRVLDGSPQLRDVKLYCSVGYAAVERAATRLKRLKRIHVCAKSGENHELMQALPQLLCDCARLKSLSVSVKFLRVMPESVGQLRSLETLNLYGCRSLAALPESTGQLPSLVTLNLTWCDRLEALPESTGQLSSLMTLDLSDCTNLSALPESLGQLSSLETLILSWCPRLTALPESTGQLSKSLATLNITNCISLTALPESTGQLSLLTTLDISGCRSLAALPESIRMLPSLETLDLKDCDERLEALGWVSFRRGAG